MQSWGVKNEEKNTTVSLSLGEHLWVFFSLFAELQMSLRALHHWTLWAPYLFLTVFPPSALPLPVSLTLLHVNALKSFWNSAGKWEHQSIKLQFQRWCFVSRLLPTNPIKPGTCQVVVLKCGIQLQSPKPHNLITDGGVDLSAAVQEIRSFHFASSTFS